MANLAFISDRTDGLGERLRALTNAIYLADRYNGRMFYEWKNRQGQQAKYNSIDEESHVFSREFIDAYSFSVNLHEVSMLDQVDLLDLANQACGMSLIDNVKIRVPQTPLYRYVPELKDHYKSKGFKAAFDKIQFSNRICGYIRHALGTSFPKDAIALHLRAGDIIYGGYNNYARFCGKAIPWEVADAIIGQIRSEGRNVILFGQDALLLSYFAAKHQAFLATTFLDSDANAAIEVAIQEIFLMSRCSCIFAGSSGFALLASSLAGEIHRQISRLEISPIATILSLLPHRPDQAISVEQRVFSLRWLIGMYGHALPPQDLLEVAQHGLSLLTDDLFFVLVKASALNALGFDGEASKLIAFALSAYSASELTRILSPSAFGKPESRAHLLGPLIPQIPPCMLRS